MYFREKLMTKVKLQRVKNTQVTHMQTQLWEHGEEQSQASIPR